MTKKKYEIQRDWILEEMLKVAMEDEKTDHEKYKKLSGIAKKEKDRNLLCQIAEEEKRHLKALKYLFCSLFGKEPKEPCSRNNRYGGFIETIGKSIVSEYGSIAFYREILGRLSDDAVKMPIRQIMADEQRHAQFLECMLEYR